MIWATLFAISVAQGLFLILLLAIKRYKNTIASRLLIAILVTMTITNFGYFVIRTDLVNYVPQFFGVPFGMILLFGPLFYFYSRAVIDHSFQWKKKYWLHFFPYIIQLGLNMPLLLCGKSFWIEYVHILLAGDMPIYWVQKLIFAIHDLQFLIYLFFTFRLVRSSGDNYNNTHYLIPVSSRLKWIRSLTYCLALFLITVFALYVFILINGKFNLLTNYFYTLITSAIIYFISYKLVLHPELIGPDFKQKYQAYMRFTGEDGEKYIEKLKSLMNDTKIFTDPDLKLSLLAQKIGLPSHQVSKLINEKFGKSFNDYVNEYRVNEFINRISKVQNQSYTIYGIALDVGFNSKSSFNNAFKKHTGRTPSDYKISP